jgi:hypothetical protein
MLADPSGAASTVTQRTLKRLSEQKYSNLVTPGIYVGAQVTYTT